MKPKRVRVQLLGPTSEPEIIPMKKTATIEDEVGKRLGELTGKTPLFVQAQPGAGKTRAVSGKIVPWARQNGKSVLLVCPRMAPIFQAKTPIIKAVGEDSLLRKLTNEGLQDLEEIRNVTVMTTQALYVRMQTDPDSLRKFGVVVFDEVHLLLDDALFVSSTGYILKNFRYFFGNAIRIYLSATPEDVLPLLKEMEVTYTLKVLKFPSSYSFVRPWFFQDTQELVNRINCDKTSAKWLIFLPTIAEGQKLSTQLNCSVRLLNRVEREQNYEESSKILQEQKFEEKVCICTAVIDVGVNFWDPMLRNVVVFSTNPNTIIQFLGRKRRSPTESVNLFVRCPSHQELAAALRQNQELTEAVNLYHQNFTRFAQQHIMPGIDRDLRGWIRVTDEGGFELNDLVPKNLQLQRARLEKLLQRASDNKGDCRFDRFVANLLRIKLPDRSECWLDPKISGTAKAEFEQFLSISVGKPMNEVEFEQFCEQFQKLCVATYGTNGGKDRTDRSWGAKKISNRLAELDNGYALRVDPVSKVATLEVAVDADMEE